MRKGRILLVDVEPNIRITLPQILEMHGFDVTATATVGEALSAIQTDNFEVVLADLNIGQPGDGFTVVSAARRIYPQLVAIIITGYPAFETALQAIRSQVDDYVVKPTNVEQLVQLIENKMHDRKPHSPVQTKRLAVILRDHGDNIIEYWLNRVKDDPKLAAIPLSEAERTEYLPEVLAELVERLQSRPDTTSHRALSAAAKYGAARCKQDYSVPLVVNEAGLLRRCIYNVVQENLLSVDISYLISDMLQVSDTLDELLERAIEVFMTSASEPRAA